jgi:hypothetical protein
LTVLNARGEAPIFEIPFVLPMIGIDEKIKVDLTMFEPAIVILRWFITLLFIFGLALITRNMIRG